MSCCGANGSTMYELLLDWEEGVDDDRSYDGSYDGLFPHVVAARSGDGLLLLFGHGSMTKKI